MFTSTLTSKGQITIPWQIRKYLNLRPGDKVGFIVKGERITLIRKFNDIKAAFGLCRAKQSASLEDIGRGIQNAIRDKFKS